MQKNSFLFDKRAMIVLIQYIVNGTLLFLGDFVCVSIYLKLIFDKH